jgi:ABC-type transport system substrate-binding protein
MTALAPVTGWGPGIAYSRLIKTKLFPESPELTQVLEPDLALSWEQVDDITYNFKLRPGVKWHNIAPVNGREFIADDVVYTFDRQIAQKANASFLGYLDKSVAID